MTSLAFFEIFESYALEHVLFGRYSEKSMQYVLLDTIPMEETAELTWEDADGNDDYLP